MDSISATLLKNKSEIDRTKLIQLAISDDNKTLINDLMSKDIPTQIKAFRMMSSKSDLIRLIQLKEALEKLEDTYIDRALEDSEGMDMNSLAKVITLVTDSVKRTNDTINKLTQDDELFNITINNSGNTQYINNDNSINTSNNVALVTDKAGREKLRNIMTKLMAGINRNSNAVVNATPTNLDNVIDVNPND